MKRYYKKTIIYSEEIIDENVFIRGEFTTREDITDKKEELIKQWGDF